MHLDKYKLPVQVDGDANDQLQRVGMIQTAFVYNSEIKTDTDLGGITVHNLDIATKHALLNQLQPRPGIYTRFVGSNTNNVSADQLISALTYWIASGNVKQAAWMFYRMVCRLGFAQNYKDGLNDSSSTKLPDFMLLRSLSLFSRIHWSLWPIAVVIDLSLMLAALASVGPVWRDEKGFSKRTPDDVDDNLLILILTVCRAKMPTPLSWLAAKLYTKCRPWNYGCIHSETINGIMTQDLDYFSPVFGALRRYHRSGSGGNPEIAELWKPIVEKYLS